MPMSDEDISRKFWPSNQNSHNSSSLVVRFNGNGEVGISATHGLIIESLLP